MRSRRASTGIAPKNGKIHHSEKMNIYAYKLHKYSFLREKVPPAIKQLNVKGYSQLKVGFVELVFQCRKTRFYSSMGTSRISAIRSVLE